MYKLIALDMDGTLLDENKKITEETYKAIKKAKDKGIKIVLSTGRPIEGVERFLNGLELTSDDDYVISYNGSLVQSVKSRKAICNKGLTGKDLKEIYEVSKKLNVNIHAFLSGVGLVTPKNSKYTEVEAEINGIKIHEINFDEINDEDIIVKIMLIDEPEILDEAISKLPEYIYEKYHCAKSMPFFFEILNKDANKGVALDLLARHLDFQRNELIAMGDEANDIEMIKYAGMGVAMGNATDAVKKVSNLITSKNSENGVANAIEKLIFNN
ncbi:MAG: sugar-phosphatase [Clostridium sp.]